MTRKSCNDTFSIRFDDGFEWASITYLTTNPPPVGESRFLVLDGFHRVATCLGRRVLRHFWTAHTLLLYAGQVKAQEMHDVKTSGSLAISRKCKFDLALAFFAPTQNLRWFHNDRHVLRILVRCYLKGQGGGQACEFQNMEPIPNRHPDVSKTYRLQHFLVIRRAGYMIGPLHTTPRVMCNTPRGVVALSHRCPQRARKGPRWIFLNLIALTHTLPPTPKRPKCSTRPCVDAFLSGPYDAETCFKEDPSTKTM